MRDERARARDKRFVESDLADGDLLVRPLRVPLLLAPLRVWRLLRKGLGKGNRAPQGSASKSK
jgi:hypothetical protein